MDTLKENKNIIIIIAIIIICYLYLQTEEIQNLFAYVIEKWNSFSMIIKTIFVIVIILFIYGMYNKFND